MSVGEHDMATILSEAAELSAPVDRQAYLDRVCAGDHALRQRVEQLLRYHARVGRFLEQPAVVLLAPPAAAAAVIGSWIGPYRLLEQIGEGGFGTVYMAEQAVPVRRKVALKILKPGMDSREVIARFEAERQALAMMDHPHIARVLDAGATDSGRPYFVMELVRGVSITQYCDQARLSARERLLLFADVCRAVQHAHLKGIIHRDLKPGNVLVTLHDDRAVVKVIDFGIAKAISQPLTDRTLFTGFHQLLGTPLYMSPEQAQYNGLDVDTRSDMYSLGVLLYELLTGTTPCAREDMLTASVDELRRLICEQEPQRPSARVSTMHLQARTTMADQRRLDWRRPGEQLRGELDWIVMRALEKDRNRRYESASALAADIERYLRNEAVEACPPSLGYRFQKFARRNRPLLVTVLLVAASLVVGIIGTSWQALRAAAAFGAAPPKPTYTYQSLGTLGGASITAEGLNDAGDVVGISELADGSSSPFVYSAAEGMRDLNRITDSPLDVPGLNFEEEATAINDSGDVAGHFLSADDNAFHAFLWTESAGAVDLGTLAGQDTFVTALSNRSGGHVQITGYASTSSGYRAWRYNTATGTMQNLGLLSGSAGYSRAWDINSAGTAVGSASKSGKQHAFLRTLSGSMSDLGTLGGYTSYAAGINDLQSVVGTSDTSTRSSLNRFQAFLRTTTHGMFKLEPQITNLPTSLQLKIRPSRISNTGLICGPGALDPAGTAFLLIPQ